MQKFVIIQIEIEGFHNYPNAPKEVCFLENTHRHSFIIKCASKVNELNREKEIFIERKKLVTYLNKKYGSPCQFNNMSCEMIANEIIKSKILKDIAWCEVWEEKTGGARIEIV